MSQEEQGKLLNKEINLILSSISRYPDLYYLAKESLVEPNRALAGKSKNNHPWPLLPVIVCEAVSGQIERAVPAAAGLQFLTAAADVFDDIQDQDSPNSLMSKYGLRSRQTLQISFIHWHGRPSQGLKDRMLPTMSL